MKIVKDLGSIPDRGGNFIPPAGTVNENVLESDPYPTHTVFILFLQGKKPYILFKKSFRFPVNSFLNFLFYNLYFYFTVCWLFILCNAIQTGGY